MSIIVVLGATGVQGGSVVKAFSSVPGWHVRAVTRDPSKPAARQLEQGGVEVVKGDLDDPKSLAAAFEGATAVFGVTNFVETFDAEREYRQGRNIADAAVEAKVNHLIWSSLPHMTKLSNGNIAVPHCDSKAMVEEYIRETGLNATYLWVGHYMSGLASDGSFLKIQKDSDGVYTVKVPCAPSTVVSAIDAEEDVGKFVKGIVDGGSKFYGKRVLAAGEHISYADMMKQWSQVLGKPAKVQELSSKEELQAVMPIYTDGVWNMFSYFQNYGLKRGADIVNPEEVTESTVTTWMDYVKRSDWSSVL
ncbi:hypothetical protein VTN77DRAFT_3182 [Rasamsonia byssochlamydoides]|uniref:uncharacterized protein n=1 Tax=Rasamsonia byssochlamydoides TaxID=89139 RepID=UPI003742A57D